MQYRHIKNNLGFTLVEMLIVVMLMAAGYASLYSFRDNATDDSQDFEANKQALQEAIRYARNRAIAMGQPIGIEISPNSISLFQDDGTTALSLPNKPGTPYTVESDQHALQHSPLTLVNSTESTMLFFTSTGQLGSRLQANDDFSPFESPINIEIEHTPEQFETLVLISNVTGELLYQPAGDES